MDFPWNSIGKVPWARVAVTLSGNWFWCQTKVPAKLWQQLYCLAAGTIAPSANSSFHWLLPGCSPLLHASVTIARLRKYEEHIIQLKFEWHMGHKLFQFSCDLSTFAMLTLCPPLVSQRVGQACFCLFDEWSLGTNVFHALCDVNSDVFF